MAVEVHEREVVNEDGELISHERTVKDTKTLVKKNSEPDYIKLYVDAWAAFRQVNSQVNSLFFVRLMPYMTYAKSGQYLFLNAAQKRIIACDMGWKKSDALHRCNNELSKLTKAGALHRVDRGAWVVNPELVGKGDWEDISVLRATWTLSGPDAGTIEVDGQKIL